jgi:iron complex outermembrane receptor protein
MNSELFAEGSSPQQQVGLHAAMDLTRSVTFDARLRWVDELPALKVDPYFALDLRLAWKASRNVELAVVGRNVLDSAHAEFRPTNILTDTTEIESSVFGVVTINF